jgi:prepilin-type N-terminal cleavage/methylation domain-containing protein
MRIVTRLTRRAHNDDGFTLVELMMAIAIMAIILGPVTMGVVVGLRTSDETSTRLAGSNDAQLLAVWLPADIQSTGNQSGDVATSSNTDCSGITNALRLKWRETQGSTTNTYVAAYAISQDSTGRWVLNRYYCVNGGAATVHLVNRNLANSSAVSIATSGTKVSMTVTEKNTPTDPTSYTFTVSGNRRTP